MFRHRGGENVRGGTYWNLSSGNRIDIKDEGKLPGNDKSIFIRFPPIVMLLLGPILGLLYVVFLPFMAIVMMVAVVGKKILSGMFHLVKNFVSFGWRPTEAYLAGKKKENKKGSSESG